MTDEEYKGKLARTPFEPSGLVRIVEVEKGLYCGRKTIFGFFEGDHPHGYKDGSPARYFLDELTIVEQSVSTTQD